MEYSILTNEKFTAEAWVRELQDELKIWTLIPTFNLSHVCAIISRETLWGWAKAYRIEGKQGAGLPFGTGDHGHGHGYFQIDDRSHGVFLKKDGWKDPVKSLAYVMEKIIEPGWRTVSRKFPKLPNDHKMQAMLAGYNCGIGNVIVQLNNGRDPDTKTAGKDYGKDVLWRAVAWDKWLQERYGKDKGGWYGQGK